MSRKFKKHYDNFSRIILAEFLTKEVLESLDKQYTDAKLKRMERKIREDLKGMK